MSPAVTLPGPVFFKTMRFGPSLCILIAMSLMLRTMSVTSSRTPGIDENSCSTPSIWTEVIAAPCSDDNRIRRQRIAERDAEATLERLGDDRGKPLRIIAGRDLELVRLDELLPVSSESREHPHWGTRNLRRKSAEASAQLKSNAPALTGDGKPLCGIGVTSRIEVTVKPAACKARSADSRPEPGPETSTSSVRMPCSAALRAAILRRHLRGIGSGLARTLETHRPG